jgi:hypothetical protein
MMKPVFRTSFCAITVGTAVPSGRGFKAPTILDRSKTEVVGSNPARGMNTCPIFAALCWRV